MVERFIGTGPIEELGRAMKVFKFGGASVKDAAGVRNVAKVLSHFPDDDLLIVVSAMG